MEFESSTLSGSFGRIFVLKSRKHRTDSICFICFVAVD